MLNTINYLLKGFGFVSVDDYCQSVCHAGLGLINIAKAGLILGTIAAFIEAFVGITPMAYLAFIMLVIFEFFTGVRASIKQGKKIESRKFGRMIVKLSTYTTVLGILNLLKVNLNVFSIMGTTVNIYEWIHYVVLNMILIQLIISVIENLSRMGMMEANKILVVIKRKFEKWFDLDAERD